MASVLQQIISGSLPSLIESVEVRSAFSPPIVLNIKDILKEGPPNPVVKRVKPTIIIKGGIEQQVIAPAGVVGPDEWKRNLLILTGATAGVTALGVMAVFSVGAFSGRRKERKKQPSSGVSGLGQINLNPGVVMWVFSLGVVSSVAASLLVRRFFPEP